MKTLNDIKTEMKQRLHLVKWKLANYLNSKAAVLSNGQLKICLILFCLLFGAATILAVMDSFKTKIIIQNVKMKTALPVTVENNIGDSVNNLGLKRIHRFKLYMDSLSKYDQKKFESIIDKRPLLMDSINRIENNIQ